MFRVPWIDDKGQCRVNRGFRIQMNSAIGPYKGGLRFHPSVNLGILKFLAFEQVLQELPDHAAHGRRQGRLRLRSQGQERRRGDALLPELHDRAVPPHRPDTDVPAGDIGVGGREIGFLFGQYKRITNRVHRRADRQGFEVGGFLGPTGSYRLRLCLFCLGNVEDPKGEDTGRQGLAWYRAAATSRSTPSKSCSI